MKKTERVAFDVHGTLDDDHDNMLRDILYWVLRKGKKVFIISGPPEAQITKEITELGINPKYVTIISVVDWLKEKGVDMWQNEDGNWWCSEGEWWASKGEICREYGIDIIFDDIYKYKHYMPKSTAFINWSGYKKRVV